MPIVRTEVEVDQHTQQGGARYIVERHFDHLGSQYLVGPWLAQTGFDYQSKVDQRVVEINEQLAELEVSRELNGVAS